MTGLRRAADRARTEVGEPVHVHAARPAILVNPAARRLQRAPRLLDAIRALAGTSADVIVPDSLPGLESAAREIVHRGVESLLLVGGDGTYMTALSALDRARGVHPLPAVALANAGTMGTVSRGLGGSRSTLRAVRAFCERRAPTIAAQPTLRAVCDDGSSRVGFIFATGLVARFFEKYDAAGGGVLAAASIAARLFAGGLVGTRYAADALAPMPGRVSVDGRQLEPRAWGVIVSSVLEDVGLHIRATYRGGEDPMRPHVMATPIGPRQLALNFPRVLAGRSVIGSGTFDGLVERFQLDFGENPGPWIFDGDTIRSRTVELSAGPILRLMRGV